jgi:hypothetical protein
MEGPRILAPSTLQDKKAQESARAVPNVTVIHPVAPEVKLRRVTPKKSEPPANCGVRGTKMAQFLHFSSCFTKQWRAVQIYQPRL